MYVSPISIRLVRGRSMPAIRAISKSSYPLTLNLPLPLLVLLIRADHPNDAFPADDLALVANLTNRCPDFHAATSTCIRISLQPRDDSTPPGIDPGKLQAHAIP